jgi:sensor histidine kinase YesM
MQINLYTAAIWTVALITGIASVALFLGSKKETPKLFAKCCITISLWITAVGILISTSNDDSLFFARLNYFLAIAVAIHFLHFFYSFPHDNKPPKALKIFQIVATFTLFYLFVFTDTLIKSVFPLSDAPGWGWTFGKWSILFELSFFGIFFYEATSIYKKYFSETNPRTKQHLKYMFWIVLIGFIPPSVCGIILPRFDYFDLNWAGPLTQIFWLPIMAYSIIKHRLFNTKIIAIEIVTFILWSIILLRTFLARNVHEILIELVLLMVTVIFSILLIRSMFREQEQREIIERLSGNLKAAYANIKELNESLEDIQRKLL